MRGTAWCVVLLALVVFPVLSLFFSAWRVVNLAPPERLGVVPDDTFYYLGVARGLIREGAWTFDSGISQTSGFHLLHAYVLAAFYFLFQPGEEAFVAAAIGIGAIAALPAVIIAVSVTVRAKLILPAMLLAIILLSRNLHLNLTSGVEWGWVVSFAALYCLVLLKYWRNPGRHWLAGIFLIALLGSLARTDFGLFPFMTVAAATPYAYKAKSGHWLSAPLTGLLGSLTGLLIVFLHNFWWTGDFIKSSARMKRHWMEFYGPSARPIADKVFELFGEASAFTEMLVLCLIAVPTYAGVRTTLSTWRISNAEQPSLESGTFILWLAAFGSFPGYLALYASAPPAVQPWYTANLLVPLFVLLMFPLTEQWGAKSGRNLCACLLAILLAREIVAGHALRVRPEWPYQASMRDAAQHLKNIAEDGRVGSWNAGILGYYTGGKVVNLDGLVNNDIYEYARQNRLAEYMEVTSIKYICDFDSMLRNKRKVQRGGYDDQEFLERLKPERVFTPAPTAQGNLVLYRLRPD